MTVPAVVDQLADTWQRTADLCATFADAEWERPTDCPGWTVRDQLAHLVGTESMLLGRSTPPAPPVVPAHVRNAIGEINEAWVAHFRSRPAAEVLAAFREVTTLRLERLRAMDEAAWMAETPSPIGVVPYRTFMEVRVLDCWLHEQDIRRAVGRPGGLEGPAAEAAIDRLLQTLGYVVGKRTAPPDGTIVRVELTGPVMRTVAVQMRDGRAERIDAGDGSGTDGERPTGTTAGIGAADTTLRMDSETFACLCAGRWRAEDVVAAGRAVVAGDVALGRRVLENLATMI